MGLKFESTKTFCHSEGISAAFRQWKADSHCSFIHGYALEVKLTFEGELDERNWVVDFGGLKEVKQWLKDNFDHKLLVAKNDPELKLFQEMHKKKVADVNIVEAVGCEKFAEMIFEHVHAWLIAKQAHLGGRILTYLKSVEVREHEGNSAIVRWS